MADITVQPAKRVANDLTLSDPTNSTGDKFVNTGREMLVVINSSVSSINVTITTPATVDGLAITDKVIAVGAGKTALLGSFPRSTYNDGDNKVSFVCSAVADVKVAVIRER